MTFRTALLAICMVFVPAVALFSHRVPSGIRASVREAAAAGVTWCREVVCRPTAAAIEPAVVPERAAAVVPGPQGGAGEQPRAAPVTDPAGQLAACGATSLECRPLPGPHGGHVASCMMPLDTAGQLVRVFHAMGGDPHEAYAVLLAEVDGWRRGGGGAARQAATATQHPYR